MIPLCKHKGKRIGIGDAKCAGAVSVYNCKLLELPCVVHRIQVYSMTIHDQPVPIEALLYCNLCQYNTSKDNHGTVPGC